MDGLLSNGKEEGGQRAFLLDGLLSNGEEEGGQRAFLLDGLETSFAALKSSVISMNVGSMLSAVLATQ